VRGKLPSARVDDPIDTAPMAAIWSPRDTDPASLRLGALALQVEVGMKEDIIASIEAEHQEIIEESRWKADLLLALAQSEAGHHAQALEHAERVLARFPESSRARGLVGSEMLSLGRIDEAEARIEAWAAEAPTEGWPLDLLLLAAHKRGDVEQASARFDRMQSQGTVGPIDLNNQAWFLLAQGHGEDALPLAERAVRLVSGRASLHTLACVQADLGRLVEARSTVLDRIERFEGGNAAAPDALVFGRIAEHLGEAAEAAEIYRRALPGIDDESTRRMTERRLEALEPKLPSPAPGSPPGRRGRR
jgi:tetratricopeptide (TPR) repeat protein